MYRFNFGSPSQLQFHCIYLIPIWRDNSDILASLFFQPGHHFFPNHINLPLIFVPTGVISRGRPIDLQNIRFIMVFGHNNQLSIIEFLIAKLNDLGMTSIVLPQKHCRAVKPRLYCSR